MKEATCELVRAVKVACPHCGSTQLVEDGAPYGDAVEIANYGDWYCFECNHFYELPERHTIPAPVPAT